MDSRDGDAGKLGVGVESRGGGESCEAVPDDDVTRSGGGGGRERVSLRRVLRGEAADSGMTTAEYAVGTLAACGFAGLLLKVLTSAGMGTVLRHLVERALAVAG